MKGDGPYSFCLSCIECHRSLEAVLRLINVDLPVLFRSQERLPTVPLSGMFNKSGGKVRLTFKLEQDQLWIGTKGEITAGLDSLKLLQTQTQMIKCSLFCVVFFSLQRERRKSQWAPLKT